MATGPILDTPAARLQTTDATITTAITFGTTSGRGYSVWAQAAGFNQDGYGDGYGAGYIRSAAFKNIAGTLTQAGSTLGVATHEDDIGWEVSITLSGTNILIRVQGDTGKTVEWGVSARILEIDE